MNLGFMGDSQNALFSFLLGGRRKRRRWVKKKKQGSEEQGPLSGPTGMHRTRGKQQWCWLLVSCHGHQHHLILIQEVKEQKKIFLPNVFLLYMHVCQLDGYITRPTTHTSFAQLMFCFIKCPPRKEKENPPKSYVEKGKSEDKNLIRGHKKARWSYVFESQDLQNFCDLCKYLSRNGF